MGGISEGLSNSHGAWDHGAMGPWKPWVGREGRSGWCHGHGAMGPWGHRAMGAGWGGERAGERAELAEGVGRRWKPPENISCHSQLIGSRGHGAMGKGPWDYGAIGP